mmetsp:Transcript_18183/g.31111  ORF Transcript_18183/g.31111 Transcript_18183/m.31111 type:complete len:231 (-) Transcript_18183:67-759(-)
MQLVCALGHTQLQSEPEGGGEQGAAPAAEPRGLGRSSGGLLRGSGRRADVAEECHEHSADPGSLGKHRLLLLHDGGDLPKASGLLRDGLPVVPALPCGHPGPPLPLPQLRPPPQPEAHAGLEGGGRLRASVPRAQPALPPAGHHGLLPPADGLQHRDLLLHAPPEPEVRAAAARGSGVSRAAFLLPADPHRRHLEALDGAVPRQRELLLLPHRHPQHGRRRGLHRRAQLP